MVSNPGHSREHGDSHAAHSDAAASPTAAFASSREALAAGAIVVKSDWLAASALAQAASEALPGATVARVRDPELATGIFARSYRGLAMLGACSADRAKRRARRRGKDKGQAEIGIDTGK